MNCWFYSKGTPSEDFTGMGLTLQGSDRQAKIADFTLQSVFLLPFPACWQAGND